MNEPSPKILTHYLVTDLGGVTRGRAAWDASTSGPKRSVGWVPVNQMITPFDSIASPNPWGSSGDQRLYPDPTTRVEVNLADGRHARLYLCTIGELNGDDWDVCARTFLKRAVARLESAGLRFMVAFEQEFWLTALNPSSTIPAGAGFSFARFMAHEPFGSEAMGVLERAGLEPEMLLPEFARDQFELTLKPAWGVAGADRAVLARELMRLTATSFDRRASFTPLRAAGGIGSGVHIHFSLWDLDGKPVLYDSTGTGGLSTIGAAFAGGIVRDMPSLCALTAPSLISYERLQPHRWSSAYTCMGDRNREATLRVCPIVTNGGLEAAHQFNLEWRAADATANPYLALGALINAGLDGIADDLPAPPLVNQDPATLSESERRSKNIVRLPTSLSEALDALRGNPRARSWFSEPLLNAYLLLKDFEVSTSGDESLATIYERYEQVF